ncbi:MAG: ketoacyl-ACP synthase III [Candidatus Coatesbacteria bacterium]|nr:ketoacyl-ACP synthase III [Candidatus Coatesbacteria bacterium]
MVQARIMSIGSYVPDKVVTNFDLMKIVDTTDEWMTSMTGIKERHYCADDEAASDLAHRAAVKALESASVAPEDIEIIIVATATSDMAFPSTACLTQELLGAKNAMAFDVTAGCSGFICGLSVATNMIRAGRYKTILVIGSETLSKFSDFEDRNTCVLFGDGAGAVVVQASDDSEESRIISVHLKSDGSYADSLKLPAGGSRNPASLETVQKRMHYIYMDGQTTFKMAIRCMASISTQALEEQNMTVDQMKMLFPHQANWRIIEGLVKKLGTTMDKIIPSIQKYGNTSAASIPISLDEAQATGKIVKGDLILLTAFGAGYTWGSSIVRW